MYGVLCLTIMFNQNVAKVQYIIRNHSVQKCSVHTILNVASLISAIPSNRKTNNKERNSDDKAHLCKHCIFRKT